MRKLIAALACRSEGSRLYGKPLQNLDIADGYNILDNIVACLIQCRSIDEIVLGVSSGEANYVYHQYANINHIKSISGDQEDVLSRLIQCGEVSDATDIFRVTSESPFPCFDLIDVAWASHLDKDADATFLDHVIDGCNFEIIRLDALKKSHEYGTIRHRSELCTLYIRENKEKFNLNYLAAPSFLQRKDLRLTVDFPEDLILARAVYDQFKEKAPTIPLRDIVDFLDQNKWLVELIEPHCEAGYESMYV